MNAIKSYLSSHIKPIGLLLAAVYTAVRPWLIDGQTWTGASWLAFALFLGGVLVAFLQKNSTTGIAYYAKTIWIVLAAGIGALVQVLPDGFSRADTGTVIVAVGAALWSLIDGTTPRHES